MEELKQNVNIETIYGLRYDSLFKHVYSKKQNLKCLFSDLFQEELEDFSYDNKEFPKGNVHLRCGYSDMIVKTKNRIILLEVQNEDLKNFPIRLKRYISMLYVNQETDENYRNVLPVEAYAILNYKEGKEKVLKEFSELERELQEEFDHLSRIKVWNIKEAIQEKGSINHDYARLFELDKCKKEEALEILEEERQKESLKPVVESIMRYNMDVENYRRLEEMRMFETTFELETSMLREYAIEEGRALGVEQGLKEGRAQGISQGQIQGIAQGKKEEKLKLTQNLLRENVPIEFIARVTELSKEQIMEYARI